jgi:hypothetical protein
METNCLFQESGSGLQSAKVTNIIPTGEKKKGNNVIMSGGKNTTPLNHFIPRLSPVFKPALRARLHRSPEAQKGAFHFPENTG